MLRRFNDPCIEGRWNRSYYWYRGWQRMRYECKAVKAKRDNAEALEMAGWT